LESVILPDKISLPITTIAAVLVRSALIVCLPFSPALRRA